MQQLAVAAPAKPTANISTYKSWHNNWLKLARSLPSTLGSDEGGLGPGNTLPSLSQRDFPRWHVVVQGLPSHARAFRGWFRSCSVPAKLVRAWTKAVDYLDVVAPLALDLLADPEGVIPDDSVGETNTADWASLREYLPGLRNALMGLALQCNRAAQQAEIDARRRVLDQQLALEEQSQPKPGVKTKKSVKLNEWQADKLNRVLKTLFKDHPAPAEDAKQEEQPVITFDPDDVRKQAAQHLLKRKQQVGLVRHSVVVVGYVNRFARAKLKDYSPTYAGETQQHSLGMSRDYVPGYWVLNTALLLGTPKGLDYSEVCDILNAMLPPNTPLAAHQWNITRGSHDYWLVLPSAISGLLVDEWDLSRK